jgi:hypothetical protein
MGEDSDKRRKEGARREPGEEPGGSAFGQSDTRAFGPQPTEVLHRGTGSDAAGERPTRPVRRPAFLEESWPPALLDPPPTEALVTDELQCLHSHPSGEDFERTSPEPFSADAALAEAKRVLRAVAKEPTHHEMILRHDERSLTPTEAERSAPRPVTGCGGALEAPDVFEERTVSFESAAAAPDFGLERTDEDGRLLGEVVTVADESSEEEDVAEAFVGEPTAAVQETYREELQAFGFARVFDPNQPPAHDDVRLQAVSRSDEWPEITLSKLPRIPRPIEKKSRWWIPVVLVTVFLFALAATGGAFLLLGRAKAKAPPPATASPR